jgi:plasmid stabilization system protein ParE
LKVVLSARAERDVERLWAFLASKNPRAADRFLDEIERAYRSLSDFPDRGRPARPDFRELVVPRARHTWQLGVPLAFLLIPRVILDRLREGRTLDRVRLRLQRQMRPHTAK